MKRLRLLFDTTWAIDRGGTGRYVRSVQAALGSDTAVVVIAVAAPRLTNGPRWLRMPINGILHLVWTQIGIPILARWHRVDLIQTTMTAPLWCPCPNLLTLHDALDFLPAFRPSRVWSGYMRTVGALAARRASVVLTGTNASGSEIVRYYGITPERLRVTPYGSALIGAAADWLNRRCMQPDADAGVAAYVLLIGTANHRKDIGTGLEAVALVRDHGIALDAVVVGTVPDAFKGMEWVRTLANVTDDDLAMMYARALAVLVPSRHEGYGLPVVEALAFGTPVIASDLPALREVGGPAARYAPAGNVARFATELAQIAADPAGARQMVAGAAQAARTMTWDATAQATIAIYHELVKSRE